MPSPIRANRRTSRPPKYSRQKEKGRADRAVVRINGRRINLGIYGSSASREKYNEILSARPPETAVPPPASDRPTVSELLVQFLTWADEYYFCSAT